MTLGLLNSVCLQDLAIAKQHITTIAGMGEKIKAKEAAHATGEGSNYLLIS